VGAMSLGQGPMLNFFHIFLRAGWQEMAYCRAVKENRKLIGHQVARSIISSMIVFAADI
jgi:hypothetical protein